MSLDVMVDLTGDGRVTIDDWGAYDYARAVPAPSASTTGPTGPLTDRGSGTWTISQPGVYENFRIDGGQIVITVNNVTLRNFEIVRPSTTGAAIKFSSTDLTGGIIEDGSIHGGSATNGVSGSGYIARRLHIYDMRSDAFRVKKNVIIEGCYVHDLGQGPESHGDGVQMYPTDGGNIRILGNNIDVSGANAALFQVNGGWFIAANTFAGGNYTVQCGGEVGNVFAGNRFGGSPKYGPIRVGSGDEELLTWVDNTYRGEPLFL
jgi:hypothetical protein